MDMGLPQPAEAHARAHQLGTWAGLGTVGKKRASPSFHFRGLFSFDEVAMAVWWLTLFRTNTCMAVLSETSPLGDRSSFTRLIITCRIIRLVLFDTDSLST